jgi:hypothetical protein
MQIIHKKYLKIFYWLSHSSHSIFYERTGTIGNKSETPIPRLPHFQGFVEQERKRRGAYLFVAGEGHDEDLSVWRWHRYYTARYTGREHASGERSPAGPIRGEGREDERDVRRWWKRWCVHDVKRSRGRAMTTTRVGIEARVGRIRGGDACCYALCREWGGAEVEAWGEREKK